MSQSETRANEPDALAVYSIDDEVWWIASSESEALAGLLSIDGDVDPDCTVALKLSESDLETLTYFDDLESREGQRTFAEQVQNLKRDGKWLPGIFAVAE